MFDFEKSIEIQLKRTAGIIYDQYIRVQGLIENLVKDYNFVLQMIYVPCNGMVAYVIN